MFNQVQAANKKLKGYVTVPPCGVGGLLSGSAVSAEGISPDCRTIGIEPELTDDATRSFQIKSCINKVSYE